MKYEEETAKLLSKILNDKEYEFNENNIKLIIIIVL
jgi:hypothetical protein